jgi:hypothetical protein
MIGVATTLIGLVKAAWVQPASINLLVRPLCFFFSPWLTVRVRPMVPCRYAKRQLREGTQ